MFHSCRNFASPPLWVSVLGLHQGAGGGHRGLSQVLQAVYTVRVDKAPSPQHQARLAWVLHPVLQETGPLCQPVAKMFTQVAEQRSAQSSATRKRLPAHKGRRGGAAPNPAEPR